MSFSEAPTNTPQVHRAHHSPEKAHSGSARTFDFDQSVAGVRLPPKASAKIHVALWRECD